jgi:hypothetical protein
MKLAKELAKEFRGKRNLLVEKDGNGKYWVSDTYIAVLLDPYDYGEFKAKYNSYKTTKSIPEDIEHAIKIVAGELTLHDEEIMPNVVSDQLDHRVQTTDEVIASLGQPGIRRLVSNDLGDIYMSRDFEFLLTGPYDSPEIYTSGKLQPLHILENGHLRALIMPVRGIDK